jgi:drug/metabolite transporter (DMT)-like permease
MPLFLVLYSAPFLGERVGPKECAAAALGFAGGLVMLRPNPVELSVAIFLPIIAAALYALALIVGTGILVLKR